MSEKSYLKEQIERARRVVSRKPHDEAAQERLEFLLEQYRAVDTTVWGCPSLNLEEVRCSRG